MVNEEGGIKVERCEKLFFFANSIVLAALELRYALFACFRYRVNSVLLEF